MQRLARAVSSPRIFQKAATAAGNYAKVLHMNNPGGLVNRRWTDLEIDQTGEMNVKACSGCGDCLDGLAAAVSVISVCGL